MTKTDFEAIAAMVKGMRDKAEDEVANGTMRFAIKITAARLARDMADHFAARNPRFDRDKFLGACGIE